MVGFSYAVVAAARGATRPATHHPTIAWGTGQQLPLRQDDNLHMIYLPRKKTMPRWLWNFAVTIRC
jgi:hypothetical protein